MSYSYHTVDGFNTQPEQPSSSPAAMIVSAVSAVAGVSLLAVSGLQTLHSHSVANYAVAPVVTSATTAVQGVAALPRFTARPQQRVAQTAVPLYAQSASEEPMMVSGSAAEPTGMKAAMGGLFLAVAAAVGYTGRIAMAATTGRPTLSQTKMSFLELSDSSISPMINNPLQELLAQHHLIRFNTKYQYDEVFGLGIVTVLNQLLEGLGEEESTRIQTAYFASLGDDVNAIKADAAALEEWARTSGKTNGLKMDSADGDATKEKLMAIAARVAGGDWLYTKFFSIGLFQVLQQSGQTDPEHFTELVAAMSLDKDRVTKDLKIYKDLLKKLEMAKDMQKEFLNRERKKAAERLAAKEAATAAN